jgi:gluconate 2-dehydrogenase alpha chain
MAAMPSDYDMVIVGLGPAGSVMAREMARAGMRVLALEKGPAYTAEDFALKHDEIRYHVRLQLSPDVIQDPITWRPRATERARVLPWAVGPLHLGPLFLPPTTGVGGGSIHWAAWAWRQREADFRMRSAIVERFGEAAVEGTTLVDWPITYRDLEPYYELAEQEIGVSGRAGNLDGRLQEGGNPFETPRRRDYPMPPLRPGAADELFVRACRKLGLHPFPAPAAINSVEYRGRSACTYCGFCRDYPCHVGAKATTTTSLVPEALATGNLEIRPLSRVFRVDRDAQGRAVGVSYYDLVTRRECRVRAEWVVLAAYALENARLLLLSGIDGNGHVGRHYMTHNYGWFTAVLPEATNPFMGPAVAASVVDDFTSELVRDQEGVVWGTPIIGFTGDVQPIEAVHGMPPDVPRFGQRFKDWLRENYRRLYSMYSQTPTFPRPEFFCDLDPEVKDPFGQPALRLTHDWVEHDLKGVQGAARIKHRIAQEMGALQVWEAPYAPPYHISTHELGTHRMGDDPRASVVDRFGRCHQCPNLLAVGGGMFPTYGSYNPTLTIFALAFWAADHLRAELRLGSVVTSR